MDLRQAEALGGSMGERAIGASCALATFALWLALAPAAAAIGVYRYVDEHGVVHFTDAPADPRFRKVTLPTSRVRFNYYASARDRKSVV
jgi:hypothetical protein